MGAVRERWQWGVLGLILLGRVVMQLLLYRSGFQALTADEFGRLVIAGQWAQAPQPIWSGVWLPLHAYFYGSALWLVRELLWWPRLLTMLLGLLSLVLTERLATLLFRDRRVGLLAAALLALNPAHLWLSATPLTEMLAGTLGLVAGLGGALGLRTGRSRPLLWGTVALGLANGVRFEAWMLSAVWSSGLLVLAGLRARMQGVRAVGLLVVAAGLPWLFPTGWLVGNFLAEGDPLAFRRSIQGYKLQWYGPGHSFRPYLDTLLRLEPLSVVAGVALLQTALRARDTAARGYVALAVLPFALFLALHGGQVEPPGNLIRYLAPFGFLWYPALAATLIALWGWLRPGVGRGVLAAGVLVALTLVQGRTAFSFQNDPAAAGVEVGQAIRAWRAAAGAETPQPVLVEVAYWQYLAIHVGANDLAGLVYDRPLDPVNRTGQSLFLEAPAVARGCLVAQRVALVVAHSPEVRAAAEALFGGPPLREVNGYALYPVPATLARSGPIAPCPPGTAGR